MGTCRSFDLIRSIAKSRKSDQMSINCFASKTKGYDISVACCSWHLGSIKFKTSICHYWKPWLISLFHSSIHIRCKKCLFFALNNDLYNITENQLKCRIQSSSACTLRLVKLHIVSWHMKLNLKWRGIKSWIYFSKIFTDGIFFKSTILRIYYSNWSVRLSV